MLMQDVRYAFRSLLKSPGFTAIAVACLALGIGVNATIFSVVDGVILKPFPYPDPEQIVAIHSTNQKERVNRGALSYADFKDVRDSSSTIQSIAAFSQRSLTLADGSGDPERYSGATVSWTLFHLLGMQPIAGRNFAATDDRPGAEPVVLLSYDIWERRLPEIPGGHQSRDQHQWPSAYGDRCDAPEVQVPGKPIHVGADRDVFRRGAAQPAQRERVRPAEAWRHTGPGPD